jgi:hypothetical protein
MLDTGIISTFRRTTEFAIHVGQIGFQYECAGLFSSGKADETHFLQKVVLVNLVVLFSRPLVCGLW